MTFYESLLNDIAYVQSAVCNLTVASCNELGHAARIDAIYDVFQERVLAAGERAFGRKREGNARHVPGWNEYIKDFYDCSRAAFLAWREAGSPRGGPVALHMRKSRALFKLVMRRCKQDEQSIRAENILKNFRDKSVNKFWKLIK